MKTGTVKRQGARNCKPRPFRPPDIAKDMLWSLDGTKDTACMRWDGDNWRFIRLLGAHGRLW